MRFVKAFLLGLFVLGTIASAAQADVRILPLGADETHLSLLQQERDALRYSVEIGELAAMDVMTKEGEFTRLLIPGFHTSKVEGSPELPMMNRLIEVPYGASVRIEVLSSESRSIPLSDLGIDNLVFPAQPSMPKDADPATWPFVYDRSTYTGRVAQDLVKVIDLGRLRAVDLGRVEVSPVEYFPTENRIVVHERLEFSVIFEDADHASGDALKAGTNSPFFECIYDQIEGLRGIHDNFPDPVRDIVTMVIVTPPEFEAQMQDFADWKVERGFHMILAVTGTPDVGTTKESIQAYLHDLYNNGTPELPSPSFVLFVGDIQQMPTWTMSGDATDRPYCDVDDDLVPDMYYGRFSATNPTMLDAIIEKTLMYDQFTMPDPAYLGEVVMIAGMDSGHGAVWGNGQINYGTTYYFNEAHGIYSHTYLYPESGGNAANIVQNVSDGVAYVNYTAHGSSTSWSDPSFTQANINSLQNYGEYCLAVGNCCNTSEYDYGECFAETWLRAEDKGAIGYIGGSNSTYWDEDYYWGVGYTSNIVANPTYEDTGIGAYDGLFHDHGEAMDQWYVTNDALIFSGNLAVMESGSSRITYYWNIYNLMGDPSLSTYLGVPSANPVVHPETIFTTWTSFEVEAVPGSYVGLTKDGVLIGAGTVDETGTLDLQILEEPFTPGIAHMVVMAQNREPYVVDLNVIVPATVYIDPGSIDAEVETVLSIGVFEYDGTTPKPGIDVWAEGLGYESVHATTDATGYCDITVNYPYGPTLDICGKDPSESWNLFREPLLVRAGLLLLPNLWVTTEVGLSDTLAMNLPGTLHAFVSEPEHTLWALLNDEPIGSTTESTLEVTPTELGDLTGVIAVPGHNLYQETFPVIEAYGTLTGHVDASGSPAAGAIVQGHDEMRQVIFEAIVDAQGNYDIGSDILVAPYTVTVDYFGYLHWEQSYFVNYGANVLDVDLDPAPSGVITGYVRENETDIPLEATVKIYRSDTGDLYSQTISDPVDGSYTTELLPYFDYNVNVKAWHHIPINTSITIEDEVTTRNFWLDPTIGDLLVVEDPGKGGWIEPKLDEKTGEVIAEGHFSEPGKATADLLADLETLGYTTTVESMSGTDPLQWENYDLMIVCAGDNVDPFGDATFRSDLISFVESGGRLLIEGGEVGYDHYGSGEFAEKVLHITGWDHDQSGNVTVAEPTHYVMSVPNPISSPVSMGYNNYRDHDALDQTEDAVKVGAWSSYPENASIIAYDPNPAPEGGQIVFYAFNYSAMDAEVRPQLLQNTVNWLMTPEIGDCSVSGRVILVGESDHSGVRVEAIPGGGHAYTDVTGDYSLPGLFAGPYTIKATKDGWSTGIEDVSLSQGEDLTGVDFVLGPIYTEQRCSQPGLSIPDDNPTGVYDTIGILVNELVSDVSVYVDITHTYQGDLIVTLTSPRGTTVTLHDRTGGTAENIIGWYPDDIEPAQSLDAFTGERMGGIWTLHVSDHAGADTGTLNEWCVNITYGDTSTEDVESLDLPKVLALRANHPNPFNPMTSISFALPTTGDVDLAVFDVAGRRVATLVSGRTEAGRYDVVWEGRDDAGTPVTGGLYFYRLKTDTKVLTKKMLLLK